MNCSQLELLLYSTVRLLLYLDKLDIDDFYSVCVRTSLSTKEVIETKCGSMQGAISFLLSFSNPVEKPLHFLPNKAYYFELRGKSIADTPTDIDHVFTLINDGHDWLIIDSYINCRGFTCRIVTLDSILSILSRLERKFNSESWLQLTECREKDTITEKIDIAVYQYDYSISTMDSQFIKLIDSAKHRLEHEKIGLSDEYLFLISSNLDPKVADNYLNSLFNLLTSQ